MNLDAQVRASFTTAFGGAPDGVVRAPGRVNLIGEHTDYNNGFVLPCALSVGTRVAFRARPDRAVRVVACEFANERDVFELDETIGPGGGWRDYVRGVATALGPATLSGLELVIAGDVPRGAGLSSSASLEVAFGLAACVAAGRAANPVELAQAGQRAENEFVGVQCGIMDQLVSAAAVRDAALLIDCRSLTYELVPFPADAAIAIVQSGVERGLVGGKYNQRRLECAEATAALEVATLRDATLEMLGTSEELFGPVPYRRARHVITENTRVLAAARSLAANDLAGLGEWMAASHRSMRDDFAITVPAVDQLVEIAQAAVAELADGRGGARMTGGGFGGAVVVVAPSERLPAVVSRIAGAYRCPAGQPPGILIDRPAAGALNG